MDYAFDLPFPSLAKQRGHADIEYFLQPDSASTAGYRIESTARMEALTKSVVPQHFGSLYPVYHKGATANSLESRLVFVRRDKGRLEHGIQRADTALYEKAKFNVLLYPGSGVKNNIDYGGHNDWKKMDPKWQSILRLYTWPRVFRAPTIVSRKPYPCQIWN